MKLNDKLVATRKLNKIQGRRPDLIIMDDIIESPDTKEFRDAVRKWCDKCNQTKEQFK